MNAREAIAKHLENLRRSTGPAHSTEWQSTAGAARQRRGAATAADRAGYVIDDMCDGVRLHAELAEIDRFSLKLRVLEVGRLDPPQQVSADVERLRRQADSITRRISYLHGRFSIVELDELNGVAQLRTTPPVREEETTSYHEILLRRNHTLSLCRYQVSGTPAVRKVVPSSMTQEAFERLCDDFLEVLAI